MKIEVTKTCPFSESQQYKVKYKYRGIKGSFLVYPLNLYGGNPKRELRKKVRYDAARTKKIKRNTEDTMKKEIRRLQAKEYLEKVSRNFPGGEFPGF